MAEQPAQIYATSARVRRAPKYGVFIALGLAAGLLAALILTTVFNGTEGPSPFTNVQYTSMQVFGFVALICGTVGVALGIGIALILDRTVGRKTREVAVEQLHVDDERTAIDPDNS